MVTMDNRGGGADSDVSGGGAHGRMPRNGSDGLRTPGVEALSTAACWRLVESSTIGRLAVERADGGPDVFPLDFLARDGRVYMRTAPGSKLRSIVSRPSVAFEVDGEDRRGWWSVVLRGTARRMDSQAEIDSSGVRDLVSHAPHEKLVYICLEPDIVTGRRAHTVDPRADGDTGDDPVIAISGRRTSPGQEDADGAAHGKATKPTPIPHLSPPRA